MCGKDAAMLADPTQPKVYCSIAVAGFSGHTDARNGDSRQSVGLRDRQNKFATPDSQRVPELPERRVHPNQRHEVLAQLLQKGSGTRFTNDTIQ